MKSQEIYNLVKHPWKIIIRKMADIQVIVLVLLMTWKSKAYDFFSLLSSYTFTISFIDSFPFITPIGT